MLSRTTIPSRRSWPSARTPQRPEAWSSRLVGEDMGRPTTFGNPRINTPFMDYTRKHKTNLHVLDLAALTRVIAARRA